ncbi:hypothetical protein POTOM_013208 [Populus tomentosa]|uniref:Uncharacterized protein n=1 Tax=Populus tomentosa TaxID=118781 RepID=A0A8X8D6R1_POPTO|nr:hypothetical protein POTOM_013208 [Populus tomentosa]
MGLSYVHPCDRLCSPGGGGGGGDAEQRSWVVEPLAVRVVSLAPLSDNFTETLSWLVLTRSRHKCRPSQIAQGSSVSDHCSDPEIKSLCSILYRSTCFRSYI